MQAEPKPEFCLVRNDLLFRIQSAVGLTPRGNNRGMLRRALVLGLIAWAPAGALGSPDRPRLQCNHG